MQHPSFPRTEPSLRTTLSCTPASQVIMSRAQYHQRQIPEQFWFSEQFFKFVTEATLLVEKN